MQRAARQRQQQLCCVREGREMEEGQRGVGRLGQAGQGPVRVPRALGSWGDRGPWCKRNAKLYWGRMVWHSEAGSLRDRHRAAVRLCWRARDGRCWLRVGGGRGGDPHTPGWRWGPSCAPRRGLLSAPTFNSRISPRRSCSATGRASCESPTRLAIGLLLVLSTVPMAWPPPAAAAPRKLALTLGAAGRPQARTAGPQRSCSTACRWGGGRRGTRGPGGCRCSRTKGVGGVGSLER